MGLPFVGLQAEGFGLVPMENPDCQSMKEMQVILATNYHLDYCYHHWLIQIAGVVEVAGLVTHAISFSVWLLPSSRYVSLSSFGVRNQGKTLVSAIIRLQLPI